jgi:CheY-like chemotaxis protein
MTQLSKRTILTIEDTPSFRQLIRMTLEFEGYLVREANDGKSGLELARISPPDLILLDLMMPGMSGLEVCQQLMADVRLRQVPVVVLSSSNDSDEIEACLQLGAQGYLLKPFRPKMLLDVVLEKINACAAH